MATSTATMTCGDHKPDGTGVSAGWSLKREFILGIRLSTSPFLKHRPDINLVRKAPSTLHM